MVKRGALIVGGWLAAATATAGLATAALDTLGAGILGPADPPLRADEVARRLASSTPGPSSGSPSPAAGPTTGPVAGSGSPNPGDQGDTRSRQVLSTPGGSMVAECVAGNAWLASWSPAQGYRTDDVERGPAVTVRISFKRERTEVEATVTCADGEPHLVVSDHD